MTRPSKRRNPSHARAAERAARPDLSPRNVLLAGLGAASIARRRAKDLAARAADGAARLPAVGAAAFEQTVLGAARLAERARDGIAPLRRQAEAFAREAEREFEAVAVPVLAKAGLVDPPAPKRRAPATRKSAAKRPRAH